MLVMVLSLLHHAITMLFGVYLSAAIVGVRLTRRNVLILLWFSLAIGTLFAGSYFLFGERLTEQLYPLLIHLPLVLFLTLWLKRRPELPLFAVMISYLCCQISNWVGLAILYLVQLPEVYYAVRIVVTVLVFVLLIRIVPEMSARFFRKPPRMILLFALLPVIYYLFDYATSVYTALLYSGMDVVVEFLGFVLCLVYLLFLLLYFRQYEESLEVQQRNQLMQMQQLQTEKELEALRRSERTVSILRHDLRHYLLNLSALIDSGDTAKAQNYIQELLCEAEKTVVQKYCGNEIVNLILSAHEHELVRDNLRFDYRLSLPETLPISDVDLTAILSNALENAVRAAASLPPEKRHVELDMHMDDGKLLISLKNRFSEMPVFVDGLPQTDKPGHGFGTQSIRYVVEKQKGNCQFVVDGEYFVLRIIL